MQLTGHPFIDVGMGIAAQLANRETIEQLTSADLAASVAHLDEQMEEIKKLSILGRYWLNNSYVNNPSQLPKYQKILRAAICDPVQKKGVCQVCGANQVYLNADRCWFPLAGSFVKDAVTYPGLAGKMICVDCFRALISLPLGNKLCKGGIYFFHILDSDLQIEAVKEGVRAVENAMAGGENGNSTLKVETKLSGRLELLEIAARSGMWGTTKNGRLSHKAKNGATVISFTNDKKPVYNELRLPAQALEFFGEIMRADLTALFIGWAEGWTNYVKNTKSGVYDRICDDVESRSSLAPVVGAMVRARKIPSLSKEEKQLLKIYEDVALERRTRFDALERIAERIKTDLKPIHRDSLIKQLANIRTKERLLQLLTEFVRPGKTDFLLSKEEIRILQEAPAGEAINLLYLLCVAKS